MITQGCGRRFLSGRVDDGAIHLWNESRVPRLQCSAETWLDFVKTSCSGSATKRDWRRLDKPTAIERDPDSLLRKRPDDRHAMKPRPVTDHQEFDDEIGVRWRWLTAVQYQ